MATDTTTIEALEQRIVNRLLSEPWVDGEPTSMPTEVADLLRSAAAELDAMRKTLTTAHLLVARDASSRPGISDAIRPFLDRAVDDFGLDVAGVRASTPPADLDEGLDETAPPASWTALGLTDTQWDPRSDR